MRQAKEADTVRSKILRLVAALGAVLGVPPQASTAANWSEKDLVEFPRYFGDPVYSPDGKKAFVLSYSGDLSCNCEWWTARVYDRSQLAGSTHSRILSGEIIKPWRTLSRRSGNGATTIAIRHAKWLPDSSNIVFEDQGTTPEQAYRWDLANNRIVPLTRNTVPSEGMQFGLKAAISDVAVHKDVSESIQARLLTETDIRRGFYQIYGRDRIVSIATNDSGKSLSLRSCFLSKYDTAWFAPDGNNILALRLPPPSSNNPKDCADPRDAIADGTIPEIYGISIGQQREWPTGQAFPVAKHVEPKIGWSADSRYALIAPNILSQTKDSDGLSPWSQLSIVDFRTHRSQKIVGPISDALSDDSVRISSIGWSSARNAFELELDREAEHWMVLVVRSANDWHAGPIIPSSVESKDSPNAERASQWLSIVQDENHAPRVLYVNGSDRSVLIPADLPDDVITRRQNPYHWVDSSDKDHTGGLILPDGCTSADRKILCNARVPLVIQAYDYDMHAFRPDGPGAFTYAAQVLASNGMAVLTLDIPRVRDKASAEGEQALFLDWITTASRKLVEDGVVDVDKVGLVGFSRAGFDVHYAIQHPNGIRFRAAVIDDAFTGSFSNYLRNTAAWGSSTEYENQHGGTFWQRRGSWLASDLTFNADKATGPILYGIHSLDMVLAHTDVIAAYRLTKRPLEVEIYPKSGHMLHIPSQRLASYVNTVDWMAFWLKGKLPRDKETALRWTRMKDQWLRQQLWESQGHLVGSTPEPKSGTSPTLALMPARRAQ